MADLHVIPGHLNELAAKQDEMAGGAEQAAATTANLKSAVWVSHGVVSEYSNRWFGRAEAARNDALKSLQQECVDLAAALRATGAAYENLDQQAGENINNQVLDR